MLTENTTANSNYREKLYEEVTNILFDSNDLNEIKSKIITKLAEAFKADRCFIRLFNSENEDFYTVDSYSEYLKSNEIQSFNSLSLPDNFKQYLNETYKKNECIFIPDVELAKDQDIIYRTAKNILKIKSNYCCPVIKEGKLLGVAVLHFIKDTVHLSEQETNLLKMIAKQLIIAVSNLSLQKENEINLKKTDLLKIITEAAVSSDDLSVFLVNAAKEIASFFQIERVIIGTNSLCNGELILKSNDLNPKEYIIQELIDYWQATILKEDNIIYIKNIEQSSLPENIKTIYKRLSVKSLYGKKIKHGGIFIGGIFFESSKELIIDKSFIEAICNQLSLIIQKMQLNLLKTKHLKRENVVKDITNTIRKSLSLQDTLQSLVSQLGQNLNADRCFFRLYDNETKSFTPFNKEAEYIKSPEIKSIQLIVKEDILNSTNNYNLDKEIFIKDVDNEALNNSAKNKNLTQFLKKHKIKSLINLPIYHNNNFLGVLVLQYIEDKTTITEHDIDFLKTLGNQSSIAIYQAINYENTKKQAIRESLLREVSSSIRSSLELNEIKKKVVTEIGKVLQADRCTLNQVNPETNFYETIDSHSEYRSSSKFKSYVGINLERDKQFNYFKEHFLKQNLIFAPEWNEYIDSIDNQQLTKEQKNIVKSYGIKSNYIFTITYHGKVVGILYLNYIKKKKHLNKDELELMKLLVDQIGIALYQGFLYKKLENNNKKEKLLTDIIATVNSSLNLNEIIESTLNLLKKFYNFEYAEPGIKLIKNCKSIYGIKIIENKTFLELKNELEICTKASCENCYIQIKSIKNIKDKSKNYKQVITIPIRLHDIKLGCIYLISNEVKSFSSEDIYLFEKIASNISIAIRDASLYTKSRFISDVSHELRTPVAIIDGYIQNLLNKEDFNTEVVEKYLNVIKNNSVRIKNIIENISILSGIEENKKEKTFTKERLNIKKVLLNSVNFLQEEAGQKNIKIITECKCTEEGEIYANEILLEQAIINIVSNAIKYSPENAVVKVYCGQKNNFITITVIDSGCGIEEKHLSNIFKRFYRVDSSRSRSTGGTGLGLSIAEQIIEMHKGRIEVHSTPQKGSKFKILIPAYKTSKK